MFPYKLFDVEVSLAAVNGHSAALAALFRLMSQAMPKYLREPL